MRYSSEVKEEARLLFEAGETYTEIGKQLGIPNNTVRRWFDPAAREKDRLQSAEYKRTRLKKGTCIDCGGPTYWSSTRCQDCRYEWLSNNPTWPPEKIVAAIQRWVKEHGRTPRSHEWRYRGEWWPGMHSVYGPKAPFKTWRAAIQAAGFDTPAHTHKTPGPGGRTWPIEEAQALREEGLSDVKIAARFGVSSSAISQALGNRPRPAPVKRKRTREERIADLQKALVQRERRTE